MAKTASKSGSKATQSKTGAGAALSERTKDAKKPAFGKAAPKKVTPAKPAAEAKPAAKPKAAAATKSAAPSKAAAPAKSAGTATPAKAAAKKPSLAKRVISKVKDTASGAVEMAASVIGKGDSKGKAAKAKAK